MALNGILRPGIVQVRVLDLDAAVTHYVSRLGLTLVSREADGRVYLRTYDEFDRHSIVLRPAETAGMDFMAFKAAPEADLDAYAARLTNHGVSVEEIAAGEQPGVGRRIAFTTPTGHCIHLYTEAAMAEDGPMITNPDVWRDEPRGMRIVRFDHCLLYGPGIPETVALFEQALDFRLAEKVVTPDGQTIGAFLTAGSKAHDVAFIQSEEAGKLHHISFFLESWHDVGHAADIIARYDISHDIGPTRHGITRGQTIYFFDPSGNRNEVFAGGYTYYPDHPTRVWGVDQLGKAIFYYERQLNERFLAVVS